jgi:phage-related protein
MAQPTLTLEVEYGLTARRGTRVRRVQFGDGYEQVVPDGANTDIRRYDIRTVPITDAQASALDDDLSSLSGDFFYAQFFQDDAKYKYRLDPNEWAWESVGPDVNIISFSCKRVYDSRD